MTPIWSPEAIADLVALRVYIEQDDPAAAQHVALHIIHNVEALLPNSPEMGRPVPGYGNTRTGDPEDAIHRAVPSGWQRDPCPAHLP